MKKNFTFSLDEKYGVFLKILKDKEKRSINLQVELSLDNYCLNKYFCTVSEFVRKENKIEEFSDFDNIPYYKA